MSDLSSQAVKQGFWSIAFSKPVAIRALKVAVIVGTALALINHGEKFLALSISLQDSVKIILSYLVPYGVSTWSAVGAIKEGFSDND